MHRILYGRSRIWYGQQPYCVLEVELIKSTAITTSTAATATTSTAADAPSTCVSHYL